MRERRKLVVRQGQCDHRAGGVVGDIGVARAVECDAQGLDESHALPGCPLSSDAADHSRLAARRSTDCTDCGVFGVRQKDRTVRANGDSAALRHRSGNQIELRGGCRAAIAKRSGRAGSGDRNQSGIRRGRVGSGSDAQRKHLIGRAGGRQVNCHTGI